MRRRRGTAKAVSVIVRCACRSREKLLTGAVVMAPMTKGSNLPYRRLCVELGARVTVSEMTLARR